MSEGAGAQAHDPAGGGGVRIISRPLAAPPPTAAVDAQLRAENLHYCVAQGYEEDVRRLLSSGGEADPAALANAPLEEGETLLHVAADAGAEAIASLLLAAGAAVNAQEAVMGRTPLLYALAQGHWGTAGALLDAGADPLLRDLEGCSAAGVAAEAGSPPPPELLSRLGC